MNIKIDGMQIECEEGKTILEIAGLHSIKIPTLCFSNRLAPKSRCRVCMVEVNDRLVAACSTKVSEQMVILTKSPRAIEARAINTELMLVDHPRLDPDTKHELITIAKDLGIKNVRFKTPRSQYPVDKNNFIVRDENLCIMCGRCVEACSQLQSVSAINFAYRGYISTISAGYEKGLNNSVCVNCGQCIHECPVNAIYEKDSLQMLEKMLRSGKIVVAQTAPSVRVALGEEFGMSENVTGKMVASLKRIGFKKVFDTNLGADITIIEESGELLKRINENENLPIFTSCCPAWVKFVEEFYPSLRFHLAAVDSPQECLGYIIKSYYAKKVHKKPKDFFVVSVMPCTSKKSEITLSEINRHGKNVDLVITTRELARLILKRGIDFKNLRDEPFDKPLGIASGGGAIFGATGGVMEAALRNAAKIMGSDQITFESARGLNSVKEGYANFGGKLVRFAVIHGLANARPLLDELARTGSSRYDAIEVMACPGGCIGGGGQPKTTSMETIKKRASLIYEIDKKSITRRSMDNPAIKRIYGDFLIKPLSKKADLHMRRKFVKRSGCNGIFQ